ncbi:MAG: PA2169 family four-helix-bundle protein [Erythrobacter sp.]
MTQTIDTLKSLTQTTYDSIEGYRKAAEKAESPALKNALNNRISDRATTLTKLNDALRTEGEEPITSSSALGSMHQVFLTITDAFEDGDEAAAERVEEGEEFLADKFRDALEDDASEIDMPVLNIIQSAYSEVREGEKFGNMIERAYA